MSFPVPGGLQLSGGVFIFSGVGDPGLRADLTSRELNTQSGSIFLRTDAPNAGVYVCVAAGTPPSPNGAPAIAATWTLLT